MNDDTRPKTAQDIAFDMEDDLLAARDLVRAVMLAAGSLQAPERHAMFRLAEVIGERLQAVEDQRMQIVRTTGAGWHGVVTRIEEVIAAFDDTVAGRVVKFNEIAAFDAGGAAREIAEAVDRGEEEDPAAAEAVRAWATGQGLSLDWLIGGNMRALIASAIIGAQAQPRETVDA